MGGLGYLSSTYNRVRLGSNPRQRIVMNEEDKLQLIEDVKHNLNTMIGMIVLSMIMQALIMLFILLYVLKMYALID